MMKDEMILDNLKLIYFVIKRMGLSLDIDDYYDARTSRFNKSSTKL